MRTEGFAAVPNWMVRDKDRPSAHAVLVYTALASHQGRGGIYPSRATLAEEAQCSVRKVADALNELEALGVIVRRRRRSKTGQATNGYDLRPGGRPGPDEVEAPDALTPEVEAHGALGGGTSEQVVPLIEEEPLKKNPLYPPDEMFEKFWALYPRRDDKKRASEIFVRLMKAGKVDLQLLLDGAERYRDHVAGRKKKFILLPTSWLNQERWNDELAADERTASPTTVEQGRAVDEILRQREARAARAVSA